MERKRAQIRHKDGNVLNNKPSNWVVLCSVCASKLPRRENKTNQEGYTMVVIFKPWLRRQLLTQAGYCCQACGCSVDDIGITTINRPQKCDYCGDWTNRRERIEWQDGKFMCRSCYEDWRNKKGRWEQQPV